MSRRHLTPVEIRPPVKVDAYRVEGKVADILERSADVPDVRKSGRGDLGESEDVLVRQVTADTDLAPGDGERLRARVRPFTSRNNRDPSAALLSMS